MQTISLRRKVKTGRLRSCQRAAHWLVPSIHLTLPFPPSRQPQPWRAASSRGSGEQVGGLGRAAEAMEASAGDDSDPGDLGAHRPAAPTECRVRVGGGEARAAPGSRQDRAPGRQPALQAFWLRRPSCQLRGARVSPPAFTRPCLCVFPPPPQVAEPGQTAAAATAEALRQAGPERCEPAGAAERPADSGEEAAAEPGGGPSLHPAGGRGPLATARCGRIPQRASAEEGLTVTHSYPPFISPHHHPAPNP